MRTLILTIFLFFFTQCDRIEPPYTEENNLPTAERTVLIEKFTGHKCSNCPEASREIDFLKEIYGEQIISVAIHPGNLTEFTETDNNYTYDFTTEDGSIIAEDMGASFLPLGTVNRINGGISNRCFTKDEWSTQIKNLLYDNDGKPLPKKVEIDITTSFNELEKELAISVNTNFIEIENTYKLSVIIIEDSIIAPQSDGTEYVVNYEHNHIYRCAVNGIYGESINTKTGSLEWSNNYMMLFNTDYNSNWTDSWNNVNNCYVISYIYNSETLVIEHAKKHRIINE